jgi:hypothetical protein
MRAGNRKIERNRASKQLTVDADAFVTAAGNSWLGSLGDSLAQRPPGSKTLASMKSDLQ